MHIGLVVRDDGKVFFEIHLLRRNFDTFFDAESGKQEGYRTDQRNDSRRDQEAVLLPFHRIDVQSVRKRSAQAERKRLHGQHNDTAADRRNDTRRRKQVVSVLFRIGHQARNAPQRDISDGVRYAPKDIRERRPKTESDIHCVRAVSVKTEADVTQYGNEVYCYDIERTICDIIRDKNKIEKYQFTDSLKRYVELKMKDIAKLYQYAEKFNIKNEVKKYIEVLN